MDKKVILIVSFLIVGIGISALLYVYTNEINLTTDNQKIMLQSTQDASFSIPVAVSQSQMKSQPAPNVAVDKTGKIYIIYQDTINEVTNLFLKTSTDNGQSFSKPLQVNSIDGDVVLDGRVAPSIKIGPNNEIYVLWANSKPEPNLFMGVYRTLVFSKSIDGGQTFLPSVGIANDELPSGKFFQNLSISGDGTIHIAWLDSPAINNGTGYLMSDDSRPSTVKYTKSTDGGISFEHTKSLDENPCPCCNVQIASDAENHVYISWRKVFGEGDTQIRDMVVATSSDNGDTFTKPVKIHEDNFNFDGCVHVGAPLAVDSKGNLHIVWYTGKNDAPGMYYTTSFDHGKTFNEPISILTADWMPPQRIFLTVDDNDVVWLAWEDATGHSANEKIWRYGETKAMIYSAQIKDGVVIKSKSPVNIDEGKYPAIASSNNSVAIVWTENDNSIMCSTVKNSL